MKNSEAFGGRALVASRIKVNDGVTLDGTIGNLASNSTYDHDGDPDTNNITVSFTCGSTATVPCRVEYTGTKVDKIHGTVLVAGTAQEIVPAAAQTDDADYLAFGVWLQEDVNTGAAGDQPGFGAFAGGGQVLDDAAEFSNELVGTATYNGAAAGVYTQGNVIEYFQGNATLTADFDKLDAGEVTDDEPGSISGTIDNIVAGGVSMSDVITLQKADIVLDVGNSGRNVDFAGRATMGTATVVGTEATYDYNGSWSGNFYRPAVDDTDTTLVEGPANTAPGAVAGTFGVSGTKDEVTTSYVGAFGARR